MPPEVEETALVETISESELFDSNGSLLKTKGKLLKKSQKGEIYGVKGIPELLYLVLKPEFSAPEKTIVERIRKIIFTESKTDLDQIYDFEEKKSLLTGELTRHFNEIGGDIPAGRRKEIIDYLVSDMVGYGPLDTLLSDDELEEVMVIGTGKPVYVAHRKFGTCLTNIIFENDTDVVKIIDKIARPLGRKIDLQTPLLDARLPDGSRVNATMPPISLGGPTLTIRKFRVDPYTIVDLLNFKTISLELAAFLWVCAEGLQRRPASILVAGGTGSGKCLDGQESVLLANGSLKQIGEIVERMCEKYQDRIVKIDDGYYLEVPESLEVFTFDPVEAKIKSATVSKLWKLKAPHHLINIKTESGRSVTTTFEHPFFTVFDGKISKIRADKLKEGSFVAIPRICKTITNSKKSIFELLQNNQIIYIKCKEKFVTKLFKNLLFKFKTYKNISTALQLKRGRLDSWRKSKKFPIIHFVKLIELANISKEKALGGILGLTTKNYNTLVKIKTLSPEVFRIAGLLVSSGHLYNRSMRVFNSNRQLLSEVRDLVYKAFGIRGKMVYLGARASYFEVNSKVIAVIFANIFNIPKNISKSDIVDLPVTIMSAQSDCLAAFISGLFDAECGVEEDNEIIFHSASKQMLEKLQYAFLRFGIHSRLHTRTTRNKIYYRLSISGQENISIFLRQFKYCKNITKLKKKKSNTNIDVIPNVCTSLSNLIREFKLTHADLAPKTAISQHLFGFYTQSKWLPSRNSLQKVVKAFKGFAKFNLLTDGSGVMNSVHEALNDLEALADSDVLWDKIEKVKIVKSKSKWVYDLTVDGTHSFIAGSGGLIVHNTTTMNCLANFIPKDTRVVSIEDTAELQLPLEHWIRFETRPPNIEGKGEITMDDLLKNTLRMRPDRIIVGEVRGGEAKTLFAAMHVGTRGCLGTVHSNSAHETISRLLNPPMSVPEIMIPTLNLITMQHKFFSREKGLIRRITEVAEVGGIEKGRVQLNRLYEWNAQADTINPTIVPSRIYNEIFEHSSLSREAFDEEVNRRKIVLTWMQKKGIRDVKSVGLTFHQYYLDPIGFSKKISKEL
ncbi:MAG: ATPase, T2SS/T4P/T4SS family [Euryarchaeota archaeon]|nr:ATPase, T2SS/T4P/T4SS family [Euryarchaeota archaeon]